jgi:hypothetical protein
MKATSTLGAILALGLLASVAHADPPYGFYNAATGGIWIANGTGANLGAIAVISATNKVKTDPALFAAIPGATFDSGDLPLGFTYLNFPQTESPFDWIFIGNVITLGTPQADLTGIYYESLANPVQKTFAFVFPEPASGVIALWAGAAMVAASRRRRL